MPIGFGFQPLVVPISLTSNTFVGRFTLHRDDILESLHVVLGHTGSAAGEVDFHAVADNNTLVTGLGMTLPSQSQLEIVPALHIPDTYAQFDPADDSLIYAVINVDLPCYLVCDASTRDIYFQIEIDDGGLFGFVAANLRRPPAGGQIT